VSRRSRAADEVLVRRIFTDHGAAVLAYASRLVGDRVRGEAVAQEALVRAWSEPALLDGPARARLFAIVRGIVGTAPEADAMALLDAVDALPPEQREVLNVLYFQGQDLVEASESLGVPAGAVKTRSYQALRGLREAVAG
jgi:RNA polymerase sigma-70 factor, ECF subfamily